MTPGVIPTPPSPPTERRDVVNLTEEQVDMIAEKAATKAVIRMTGKMYEEVGKTIIQKFFWLIGLLAVGIIAGYQYASNLFK